MKKLLPSDDQESGYEYYSEEKLIDALSLLAKSGSYVFRGYNKQDQLLPNIIREKTDYSDVEGELLIDFEKYGSHYFIANTPIDFISYGQHYGLPTRLLDFTYNPFVALRFALFSKKSNTNYKEPEDRDFYYIRYCSINSNICLKSIPMPHYFSFGHYESDSIAEKSIMVLTEFSNYIKDNNTNEAYAKGIFDCLYKSEENIETLNTKIKNKVLCFIDPNQSNQRIIMQQGLFMLPYTLDKMEHLSIIQRNTSLIRIHKSLRDPLIKYLDTLGYNTFRLRRGTGGVSSEKEGCKDAMS